MKRIWISVVAVLLCGTLVAGYRIGRARAYGIPTTSPLAYSGSLLTFGSPDNATHLMSIALYVSGSTSSACASAAPQSVTAVNGQFTIPLPAACLAVIHQNQNVNVQVTVDGTPLGMTPLTAVPYAVEADTASNPAPGSTLGTYDPPGTVVTYAGSAAPTGWLLANGQALSQTQYPALFAGRVPVGAGQGAGLTARTLGATGGEESHLLSSGEMPSPAHAITDPGHVHPTPTYNGVSGAPNYEVGTGSWTGYDYVPYVPTASATTGISVNAAGGGGSHNTMQPFIVLNYIIKT